MDLSGRRELTWLSGLIRDLRRAAPPSTPLLVGAVARDLHLHHGHEVPIARATSDIDIAFAANLLEADDFDSQKAGGWLAGHDAADQISDCSADPARLLDACEAVLSAQASPTGRLELVSETGTNVTEGLRLLQGFLDGMREGRKDRCVSR